MIYGLVGSILLTDVLWGSWSGLHISGWSKTALAAGFLMILSVMYSQRHTVISVMTENAALWMILGASGCVLTYLCATCDMKLQDPALRAIDHAIGSDWVAWRDIVVASPRLHWMLAAAYASLMPQIILSLLVLPTRGLSARCYELLLLSAVTLIVTSALSALFPALGPFAAYGGEDVTYLQHDMKLRAAGPWQFDLSTLQGIVVIPSYHTVLAVLFTHAHRQTGWAGWCIAALNGFMLLSLPPIGGHYFVDMIGGGGLTVLAILALHWWRPKPRQRSGGLEMLVINRHAPARAR